MTAPLNRDRLAKVLALMASDKDGEALAAARMVVSLLAKAGMRPEELAEEPAGKAELSGNSLLIIEGTMQGLRRRIRDLERQLAAGPDEARLEAEHVKGYQRGHKAGRAEIEREVRMEANQRIREVEAELEAYRKPLDWPDLAERFYHWNQRGPDAGFAKGLLLRARTNTLTPHDQAELRKFAEPKRTSRRAAK